jgi:hypothetical protein
MSTHQVGHQIGTSQPADNPPLSGEGSTRQAKTPLASQRIPSSVATAALMGRLGERDWQILISVRAFRYLTTRQLSRQHFSLSPSGGPIPRNANHAFARLRELGLLVHLERRIGGVRAGSGGHIWQITDLANRLLRTRFGETIGTRVRTFEPGTTFLDHTLAIAEVVITLQENTGNQRVTLKRIQLEPDCWRTYLGPSGEPKWLKPDLAVVTESAGYEDYWFIEVDRATEPPNRVVRKCFQYHEYRRTDNEQNEHGLFPAVAWVVPSERRREQLRGRLAEERVLNDRLFTIITRDELADMTVLGATEFNKQRKDREKGAAS